MNNYIKIIDSAQFSPDTIALPPPTPESTTDTRHAPDKPRLEQSYWLPLDGAESPPFAPWFDARSCQIVNASSQVIRMKFDNGATIGVPAGGVVTLNLPLSRQYTFKSAAAATGSAYVIFWGRRAILATGTVIAAP